MITRLFQAWREWFCDHWWRPCNYHLHPAKVCDDCGKVVELTPSEFYAEFGVAFSVLTNMRALEPFRKVK